MRALTLICPVVKDRTVNGFMDAKLMAKLLRQGLAERGVELGHSACLELVARQFGVADWNILSARIDAASGDSLLLPEAWHLSGRSPGKYRAGLDPEQTGIVLIASRPEFADLLGEDDFCTLMQTVDAADFRGQRLQLRAQIKAHAADGVTIWFRIDGPNGLLAFDNLERSQTDGPLTGSSDWTERTIVLEVPEDAVSLNYGVYLKGRGLGWARGFDLEPVDQTVPLNPRIDRKLRAPTNLGFSARG